MYTASLSTAFVRKLFYFKSTYVHNFFLVINFILTPYLGRTSHSQRTSSFAQTERKKFANIKYTTASLFDKHVLVQFR
jgi:hypothetical protein